MGSDIVDRLKFASEAVGIDGELKALLLEAADEIEHLRQLLDPTIEGDLDLIEPKGRA
ncbi:hypothetical protein [Microvirga rosea]|uniref:hypothetical protein n=1 Tax=Microvirga rosea TaxID=2715425 RepID=UPI001D0A1B2C|nr:hypothetical protein [Microvirga rosea]MCB8822863.1 hypothetical protein [Microvirga rosea]